MRVALARVSVDKKSRVGGWGGWEGGLTRTVVSQLSWVAVQYG